MGKTAIVLFILFTLLVLFIRSPWGQDIIVGKLTDFVTKKTQTEVAIKKLFITFSGDINLEGLYLEDQKGDTLIYSERLQVEIPLLPIIRGNPIAIDDLDWTGLRANIVRKDSIQGFNYQFLIDAFASDSSSTKTDTINNAPPKISIGSIDLSDFKVRFDDAVNGMKANLDLGKFHFEGKDFNLKKMKFEAGDIALENTIINYEQNKPSPPSDTTESKMPYLSLENLSLKNITANYKSTPDSIDARVNLADLELQVPKADLTKQDIEVGNFTLNNSNIKVEMKSSLKSEAKDTTSASQNKAFTWPDWHVDVQSLALQNNHFQYQMGKQTKKTENFNPNDIELTDFNFKGSDIALSKNKSAQITLEAFSFHEKSGLSLQQLAFTAGLKTNAFSVDNLIVKTGNSSINADLKTQFPSIEQLIKQPKKQYLELHLKQFIVDLNDAFDFEPALKENEYLDKLSKHLITGNIKADGKLSKVNLTEFVVNWGQNTAIETHGAFKNLTEPDQLMADIDDFDFHSTHSDLSEIVSEKDLGISIPKTVHIESQIKGQLNNLQTQTQLVVPEGKVKINGQFKQQDEIAFSANVDVIDFQLGEILKNPDIGTLSFKMEATGEGRTINDLNAQLASKFSKLEFNGYDFSALQMDGKLNNGKGDVELKYKDENLNLDMTSQIELDSVAPKIAIDLNLKGADLYALGLTQRKIRAKLMMDASFKGNSKQFDLETHVSDGVAVYDKNSYSLGTVDLTAGVAKDSTSMDISSQFINGKLRANAGINPISEAIQNQLVNYFSDSVTTNDSIEKPVLLEMNMKLSDTKLITDLLVPDIKSMDTVVLNANFNQKKNKLTAHFNLPYLDYADKTIDSLQLNINATENTAKFNFGFAQLDAKPFVMHQTFFDGRLKDGLLNLNFNAFDGEKEMYIVQTEISGTSSDLKIHFDPEHLVFHEEKWSIPKDNQIRIHKKNITAQNFVFQRNNQQLKIANDLKPTRENNIGLAFKNFKLANFLALLNKDELLASGNIQGDIVAINPLENFGLYTDFNIDKLTLMQADLGKLAIKAQSENGEKYNLDLTLKGSDADLKIKGDYALAESKLNFNVDLNKVRMETIATISGESLKDASGDLSGKIKIQGKANAPKYHGYLQFNEAAVNVSELNSKFHLNNDKIKIDNKTITLNQFSIQDDQNNTFSLDGSILTEDFSDPGFDLRINSKNFQPLNSTKEDNDLYYGTVNFDMDGTIKGKLSLPKVDLNIGLNESTDFTYAIQSSQAKLEKREGVIEFVNKENPDNILTRNKDSAVVSTFTGIDLHAKIKIDEGATFNVIVDPKTGDDLQITGVGDLDFNMDKNGRTTLSGRYKINDGHYNLSLYNLVKRKFEFESGSSISWHGGDPMDADMDVTAKYSLKTSASSLMASQTSGASDEVKNKYRQRLPFLVFLNVNGSLDQPKLDFRLGMPQDSRGAIDGTVYSRIKQLNTEEDALNKQVFSLLVLKKFYPNPGSDGSGGGTASIVRDNINQALSDQLNAYSDKLMGNTGVELNFGLNSYTDYQGKSAEQRTDLNVSAKKKLLDDRLIVEVGSNVNVQGDSHSGEESPVVGNANIQYLLTKDGRWRLKGFRNSEYENVIDGQVFVNGISIIFQRQFNKLNEMFGAPPKKEKADKKERNNKATENKDEESKTNKKAKD